MNEINPNVNLNYGANQNVQSTINNNTVLKTSADQKDERRKLMMTPVLGAGIYYGMKKFNQACGGDYATESLLGKAGKLGDRISKWKIIDNKFVDTVVTK